MAELSQKELDERVATTKRFRSLLLKQREKFREYLAVLEKQQNAIENENTETIFSYAELGEQVVQSIASLQKVIAPMSELRALSASSEREKKSVGDIQNELERLQTAVLAQNEKNKALLRVHIAQTQAQIKKIRNPYRASKSVYAQKQPLGSLVEVNA